MDRKASRIASLIDMLSERKAVHVKEAAVALGISEMTVRRDVAQNPGAFQFLGPHIMLSSERDAYAPYELGSAAQRNAAAKRQACQHAAAFIKPGDTIFIDCGTTTINLVDMIPANVGVTVVSCAMNVAERVARRDDVSLILLGGLYNPSSASFSGRQGDMDGLAVNVAFISAAGIDPARGATCEYFHEVPVKQKALAAAPIAYLVADASKLGVLRPARFASLSQFKSIVTEEGSRNPPR